MPSDFLSYISTRECRVNNTREVLSEAPAVGECLSQFSNVLKCAYITQQCTRNKFLIPLISFSKINQHIPMAIF